MWWFLTFLSPFPLLVHAGAQRSAAEPVRVRRQAGLRGLVNSRTWFGTAGSAEIPVAASVGVLALCACVVAAALRRIQRRSRRRGLVQPPPESTVPTDYKAAGVIFYSRNSEGDVSHVLLGVEERKVPLRDLGQGHGTSKVKVLLFPQGKREKVDGGYVDTARREFVEETADPSGLANYVASGSPLPATWFADAKMAVVFCEVPEEQVAAPARESSKAGLPLQPVWVAAMDLRRALASTSKATMDVKTNLGFFPLFPVTRRFLQTAAVMKWLGMMPRPSRKG